MPGFAFKDVPFSPEEKTLISEVHSEISQTNTPGLTPLHFYMHLVELMYLKKENECLDKELKIIKKLIALNEEIQWLIHREKLLHSSN